MEFLKLAEWQGIAGIIAIIEFIILLKDRTPGASSLSYTHTPDSSQKSVTKGPIRVIGLIVFMLLGWILYSLPWAVLAFGLGFSWWMVLSPTFLVLGSLPSLGSVVVKSAFLGGFLGGAIPLSSLALFLTSIHPQMLTAGNYFAYFVTTFVLGGLIGALSGPGTVRVVQKLGLPLPLQ